jgi:inner membrane protein
VQKILMTKAALIGAIFLALLIPLNMIGGLVQERAERQRAVTQEIAASNYGRQVLAGPVLSLPYREEYEETVSDAKGTRVEHRRIERVARFFPESQEASGNAGVSTKSRGIFKARIFDWRGTLRGEFALDGRFSPERNRAGSSITWGKPTVSVALLDPRGLIGTPALYWNDQALALERGSGLPHLGGGVHAAVPAFDPALPRRIAYSLNIGLNGTDSLAMVPLAGKDFVRLVSEWPHPGFGGQFLPLPRTSRENGFEAQWATSALASKAQQQFLEQVEGRGSCKEGICADRLEVRFVEPIDVYSLSDRAIKYGFLFIGITFGCFMLFELLTGLAIHPAQYLMVGLALATFFLLLIGFSEHIAFGLAYAIATAACVALLGVYLSAALHGLARGLSFSAMLAALYAALYGLLISEDNALLLGSLLVFGLLAAAMIITRKLDWYALGAPRPAAA